MDDQYRSILEELAKRKIEQSQSPQQMIAADREPASIGNLPSELKDAKTLEELNILDKIKMKTQGLDPWKANDVQKYRNSQSSVQMAGGGEVPSFSDPNARKTIILDSPQFIPPSDANVRYVTNPGPQEEPIDYNALNNNLNQPNSKAPIIEEISKPESKKLSPAGNELVTLDKEKTIKAPENYQERMTSEKTLEDITKELQSIPDENIGKRIKRYHEIMQNNDLSDYERQRLEDWGDQDWDRYNTVMDEQLLKENK